jgi:sugar transferase EpsL
MRRHEVRPGITGLAQVNGRNALGWEEKFELDVAYVERLSFWLDLRILVSTLAVVLGGRGVTSPGRASAVEFFGACGGVQGGVGNKEEKL